MINLWHATMLLAKDPAFRGDIQAKSRYLSGTKQPDPPALVDIFSAYLTQGLALGLYEVCELNRWCMIDKEAPAGNKPMRHLDTYWAAFSPIMPKASTTFL